MLVEDVKNILELNSQNLSCEFKRVFHGRGKLYKNFEFLTIDSIDSILSVAFYFEIDKETEYELLEMLKKFITNTSTKHDTIVLQRRYIQKTTAEVIVGVLKKDLYVVENGIKIKLNLLSNQNSGYFPDMKNGRAFIKSIAKDKKVLNLFSYTCGFSLSAISGGAISVTNIDMAKSALSTGRANHHLNNFDTYNVKFYPHNILKSFSKIKRESPYDIIIIDPPTFQKGSFETTKDYDKIIKRLDSFASEDCVVLACLNSPNLDENFIINLFKEFAPSFEFVKRLENIEEFKSLDENRSLKNLIFHKVDI
ncbi:MAG: class I SAM-dependent methyltransferase [Campylobacterota bacterium]|nr:class I SAM-dependent methyltransferase [Campylobacterota bacterium]